MTAPDIKSRHLEELKAQLQAWGEPSFRAEQLTHWLYTRRITRWEEMTNLPQALRKRLAEAFRFEQLDLVRCLGATDTTRKFLWRLADGQLIESVLIPANPALYGEASDRLTLCVSTQVGCAYGCVFCASGLAGWKRNLEAHEIVGQVLAAERAAGSAPGDRSVTNLVFMGMGEPLANYDQLLRALRILNAPWGLGIGARKITLSTSGLAPQIRQLAAEPMQVRLAISLHGATDAVRQQIMPVNRKYPLAELTAACEEYLATKGRMITFEYILIAGVNDQPAHAEPLAVLAKRLRAKVNLIPYNPVQGLAWERPAPEAQEAFLEVLLAREVQATLRREKGTDIEAACGQLRLRVEKELAQGAVGTSADAGS